MKYKRISIYVLVLLVIISSFIVGCGNEKLAEETIQTGLDDDYESDVFQDSLEELDEYVLDEEEYVLDEELVIPITEMSPEEERYLEFSTDLFCMAYGEGEILFSEEHEYDEFAQSYGYSSMEEASSAGTNYQGDEYFSMKYSEMLIEKCPEGVEAIAAIGNSFED